MKARIAAALRPEFRSLVAALRSFEKKLRKAVAENAREQTSGQRRRLSPKARAALVLQGRYMGYMRQLKPRQKAQVRKVREANGVRAAIVKARAIAAR